MSEQTYLDLRPHIDTPSPKWGETQKEMSPEALKTTITNVFVRATDKATENYTTGTRTWELFFIQETKSLVKMIQGISDDLRDFIIGEVTQRGKS